MAGAAVISAMTNALDGREFPTVFGRNRAEGGADLQRLTRVQFSPPQKAPTQPSTLIVSGPVTEMLLA